MKEWSHLPNAKHIDWVIQSLKDNQNEWVAAWGAARNAARDAAYSAARDAARDAAYDVAWGAANDVAWGAAATLSAVHSAASDAAWVAVWTAARDAAYSAARYAVVGAAWASVVALVAYDDIEHYLFSSYEELRLIAELSQHPAAILLLPAVKARELIEDKNERMVTSS